jgi:hypothetical protein
MRRNKGEYVRRITGHPGGSAWATPRLHVARKSAVEAVKTEADRYAANVLPIIREAQKAGASTLRRLL